MHRGPAGLPGPRRTRGRSRAAEIHLQKSAVHCHSTSATRRSRARRCTDSTAPAASRTRTGAPRWNAVGAAGHQTETLLIELRKRIHRCEGGSPNRVRHPPSIQRRDASTTGVRLLRRGLGRQIVERTNTMPAVQEIVRQMRTYNRPSATTQARSSRSSRLFRNICRCSFRRDSCSAVALQARSSIRSHRRSCPTGCVI